MKKIAVAVLVLIIAVVCCWLFVLIRDVSNTASQISSQFGQNLGTLSPLQTAAAYRYTPAPEGQLSVVSTRIGLEALQWFVFTDDNIDGQPAVVAKLTAEGETHYPGIGGGFTGIFLGDPNDLSQIKIMVPRTERGTQDVINEGPWLTESVLMGLLPFSSDEKGILSDWINDNFLIISVGNKQEKIIKNVQFVLERPETDLINLTVTPQK